MNKLYNTHIYIGNEDLVKRGDVRHTDECFADMLSDSIHYFYGYDSTVCKDRHDIYILINAQVPDNGDLKCYMKNAENIASLLNYLGYMCKNTSFINERKI